MIFLFLFRTLENIISRFKKTERLFLLTLMFRSVLLLREIILFSMTELLSIDFNPTQWHWQSRVHLLLKLIAPLWIRYLTKNKSNIQTRRYIQSRLWCSSSLCYIIYYISSAKKYAEYSIDATIAMLWRLPHGRDTQVLKGHVQRMSLLGKSR